MIRLDKYLAQMGCGSRQEVKKYIRQGRVSIDGKVINEADYKVADAQCASLDGTPITYVTHEYYMLNKPAGVVSATSDKRDRTVIDLIVSRKRSDLFPVGRLDKDTEGLLLITNDGDLAHRLLSPKKHVDKVYYAKVAGPVTALEAKLFAQGVNIGSQQEPEWTLPGTLEILCAGEVSEIRLRIQEGRYHQVKRMFHAVGKEVIYLKRECMGPLKLDACLAPGEYRMLTDEELRKL